jgi:hypothetical protein
MDKGIAVMEVGINRFWLINGTTMELPPEAAKLSAMSLGLREKGDLRESYIRAMLQTPTSFTIPNPEYSE